MTVLAMLMVSCGEDEMAEMQLSTESTIEWELEKQCQMKLMDNSEVLESTASIKYRGGMSSKYFKHSYALELDSPLNLCGITIEDDWVLNASYIDKTFMRHKLCYDLFREMGTHNLAPKSDFVKLLVNGQYKGLYVLMQKLTASNLGLNKLDSGAVLFKDSPIFREDLLIELRDTSNFLHQKFPKWKDISKPDALLELRDFILHSSDLEFTEKLEKFIDLQNLIDWHLLLMLSNGGDGVLKNSYLYKTDSSAPFRIALWDCDHSFGRDGDGEKNMLQTFPNFERHLLLNRLLKSNLNEYKKKLKGRWSELRKSGVFSEKNLFKKIENIRVRISSEIPFNAEKWPLNSEWYSDANSFEEEVNLIKEFIKLNLEKLDGEFGWE